MIIIYIYVYYIYIYIYTYTYLFFISCFGSSTSGVLACPLGGARLHVRSVASGGSRVACRVASFFVGLPFRQSLCRGDSRVVLCRAWQSPRSRASGRSGSPDFGPWGVAFLLPAVTPSFCFVFFLLLRGEGYRPPWSLLCRLRTRAPHFLLFYNESHDDMLHVHGHITQHQDVPRQPSVCELPPNANHHAFARAQRVRSSFVT